MDSSKAGNSLFDVYLRLRPSYHEGGERFLDVEEREEYPKHITIKPPANDYRKRAVERFAFTRVFEEASSQLDLFQDAGVLSLVEGVLGTDSNGGRDGLLATLGVTGSGKSHTILGSKTQRGLTQLALDLLFQSLDTNIIDSIAIASVFPSIAASDVSEAQLFPAAVWLDSVYGDGQSVRGSCSRAQTPMPVTPPFHRTLKPSNVHGTLPGLYPDLTDHLDNILTPSRFPPSPLRFGIQPSRSIKDTIHRLTRSQAKPRSSIKDTSFISLASSNKRIPRPSALPQIPLVDDMAIPVDRSHEYAIVISMFEVYNDRIYDLLAGAGAGNKSGAQKRRALLFKSTEPSPDRKVVAGLRKIVCSTLEEALTVLETGLIERRVAGTGSNATSSRSHGFFCVELKQRNKSKRGPWTSSTLTVVDLAGSERARQAKTAGATLAEAGKINESLMYLGQCMQMQSDNQENPNKQNIVPFRQCKLTELLFSNSYPSTAITSHHHHHHHRAPQKAIMIVTADPVGDFNATSQILRYSALAREVTVPRIPSVTSTIMVGPALTRSISSGRNTPQHIIEDLEQSYIQITRLSDQVHILGLQLQEERERRVNAEISWQAAEMRMEGVEQEIRDECYAEMESRVELERRRWKGAWEEERDMNDEHLDKKIEILARGIEVYEDEDCEVRPAAKDDVESEKMRELEDENEALRRKVDMLEREMHSRSPVKLKQRVLKGKKFTLETDENIFGGA
ncbi:putative kinesin family protein [Venturia nashicola]|uniref:Kinesin-like protein n=1 Tax=Venturia nashicola TaxID=86259 RepID=A0A4Z1PRX6_9PEZI|nr:putative kinesin family protein [Venturia nashicola]TLD37691.1 putative kinesin family protein [Venturia nashicola]